MLVTTSLAPVIPLTLSTTEPLSSRVPWAFASPAAWVSFALSLENRPVDSAANAKTEETTTKAIRTMAVSNPVIPRWPQQKELFKFSDICF